MQKQIMLVADRKENNSIRKIKIKVRSKNVLSVFQKTNQITGQEDRV